MEPLEWEDGLHLAAQELCDYNSNFGSFGHKSAKMTTLYDRIGKYGDGGFYRAESLAYGMSSPMDIVAHFMQENEHGSSAINPLGFEFTKTGIAFCDHPLTGVMAVAMYSGEFTMNQVGQDILDKYVFDKTSAGGWGEDPELIEEENDVPAFMQLEDEFLEKLEVKPYKIGSDLDYELFELTNQFRTDPSGFVDWI